MVRNWWNSSDPLNRLRFLGTFDLTTLPISYSQFNFVYKTYDDLDRIIVGWLDKLVALVDIRNKKIEEILK